MNEAVQFVQDLTVIMVAAAAGGLLCRRLGLSPVVGYLLAGLAVGPYTPSWLGVVRDVERVRLFAELGLIFLMFGIGLSFSLRRLRQLGAGVVIAAAGGALLVFSLSRTVGELMGLDRMGGMFYGALLVVSSSAVIGKLLTESGTAHDQSSQLALGVTLAEDIVAIVALTLLGTMTAGGATAGLAEVGLTVALFAGFVLVLATLGLLVVPRVLKWLGREANPEVETLFVAGLLFAVALLVVKAGYSLALGAFLLGAVMAETPQRAQLERAFSGMRDLFGAIFFVAIGMSIPVAVLPAAAGPIVVTLALAIVGRTVAVAGMLLLQGHDKVTALRAGLILTPLGEFSFVIAQLGIDRGALPTSYLAVAVGAALGTALTGPMLVKHGEGIAQALGGRAWPGVDWALALYRRVLDGLQRRRDGNLLWRLLRRRLTQIGVEVALVTAVLVLARPGVTAAVARWGETAVPVLGTKVALGGALAFLILVPLIAVLRNVQAVAMILADYLGRQSAVLRRVQGLTESMLFWPAAVLLGLWLWNVSPLEGGVWVAAGLVALMVGAGTVFWRHFIRWHSEMELSLEASIGEAPEAAQPSGLARYAPWGCHLGEVELPDQFARAGDTIGQLDLRRRFEVTVIAVERRGFRLKNPGAELTLFPGDRVLMLGTHECIASAKGWLLTPPAAEPGANDDFAELAVELVTVPTGCPVAGSRLVDLAWPRRFGVQVVGVERAGERQLTPGSDLILTVDDRLLLLATPANLTELRRELAPRADPATTEFTD